MIETLRNLIAYLPESGRFYWKLRGEEYFSSKGRCDAWNKMYAFKECFKTRDSQGYNTGAFRGKDYYAHRIAWAIFHGVWPHEEIDHINGVRSDNRIENLRAVTKAQNGRNQGVKASNASGANGVCWDKRRSKWNAAIKKGGVLYSLGYFDLFADAVSARKKAEETFGFHPNHGTRPAAPDLKAKRKKPA